MAVLAVNFGETPDRVRATVEKRGYPFPVLLDEKGVAMGAYQVFYRPATFLIEPEGRIRGLWVGPVSAEQWKEELAR